MSGLLKTRVQRNYGTDHHYLANPELALIWEDISGRKTVTARDISNLRNLTELILNDFIDSIEKHAVENAKND